MRDCLEKKSREIQSFVPFFATDEKNGKSLLLLALVLCGHVDYHGYKIDRVSKDKSSVGHSALCGNLLSAVFYSPALLPSATKVNRAFCSSAN